MKKPGIEGDDKLLLTFASCKAPASVVTHRQIDLDQMPFSNDHQIIHRELIRFRSVIACVINTFPQCECPALRAVVVLDRFRKFLGKIGSKPSDTPERSAPGH